MLEVDGSLGEGGGQVLRSSLALSMITATPLRILRIRAGRRKPGLRRQHLTAARAAAEISGARLQGAEIDATELGFTPRAITPGTYRFAIGTAGSATLVLQTVLPALLTASGPTRLTLEGGTHNPKAPPFEFLDRAFLPLINHMGPRVTTTLERPGFYPAGGGRMTVEIEPAERLRGLDLHERGKIVRRRATAIVAKLPAHIGERELRQVMRKVDWDRGWLHLEEMHDSAGPGNVLLLEIESERLTEVFTGFGQIGVRAEQVAIRAVRELRRYLKAGVPVGEHLADQLLLPLAIAGGGGFTTLPLSRHATTQIELIGRFLAVPIAVEEAAGRAVVQVG